LNCNRSIEIERDHWTGLVKGVFSLHLGFTLMMQPSVTRPSQVGVDDWVWRCHCFGNYAAIILRYKAGKTWGRPGERQSPV